MSSNLFKFLKSLHNPSKSRVNKHGRDNFLLWNYLSAHVRYIDIYVYCTYFIIDEYTLLHRVYIFTSYIITSLWRHIGDNRNILFPEDIGDNLFFIWSFEVCFCWELKIRKDMNKLISHGLCLVFRSHHYSSLLGKHDHRTTPCNMTTLQIMNSHLSNENWSWWKYRISF